MRFSSVLDLPPGMRQDAERQLVEQGVGTVVPRGTSPATSTAKPSKYRNTPVVLEGERYDSKLEYELHQLLKIRQRRGELGLVLRQVPFVLEGGVVYRADFVGTTPIAPHFCEVWDAKGCDTRSSINKRKQVLARYGIDVQLWPARPDTGRKSC